MSDFTPTIHGAGRARPTRIERAPHPWGQVQIAEQTPAAITSITGDHRARRRELQARQADYSKAEFERELEALAADTRKQVIRRVEQVQAAIAQAHELADRAEKAHPAIPTEEVDRAWRRLQPLFRVGVPLADIATRFGDDRATLEAIRFYGPNAIRGKARSLDSPQTERNIDNLLRHIEAVEHPHLPPELAEARDARRRVEGMEAVIAEHMALARREVEGQNVPAQDMIAAGLREAEANMAGPAVTTVTATR